MPDEQLTTPPALPETEPAPQLPPKSPKKFPLPTVIIAVLVLIIVVLGWLLLRPGKAGAPTQNQETSKTSDALKETKKLDGLQLEASKKYGNKYADGLLPVGDNQYATNAAAKAKVYLCNANFVPANQAGAQTRGPWFVGTTKWDMNKKTVVRGNVDWQESLSNKVEGSTRTITTNDLPNHPSGTFPVAAADPAYQYDRNPNTIKSQSLIYSLSANPTYGAPQCMGGEVGVMLTGVALFNAFDAGGRDAGAWEVQDGCEGHPQSSGLYHYHTLSSCITDVSVGTVIGFALDGFPITGPKVSDNNFLTTDDLDECHGITSEVTLDGKKVTMYHYVMTQDFPYSVSCFRSKAIQSPGQHTGGQTNQQPNQQMNSQPPQPASMPPKNPPPRL